jgi:hypothetical protein
MSSLVERLKKSPPDQSKVDVRGKDPEPVGWEHPYRPSLDLAKDEVALHKARNGSIGNGAGGYTPAKPYSSQFNDI